MSNTKQREVLSHEEIVFFIQHYEMLSEFNLKMSVISTKITFISKQPEDNYQLVNLLSTKSEPIRDSLFNDKILSFLSKISVLSIKEKLESVENVFLDTSTYLMKDTLDKMLVLLDEINKIEAASDELLVRLEKLEVTDNQNLLYVKNESITLFNTIGTMLKNFFSYASYMLGSITGIMDDVIFNTSKLGQLDSDELDKYLQLKEHFSKTQQELQSFKVKSTGMEDYSQVLEEQLNQLRKDFITKIRPIYQQYNLEFILDSEVFS